ncbi:MAG TPA: GNAT family N-acetyltransferase [Verrucomicrobiae bacterium]|jgi:ribosomal protein S18 acetylase RimI-like enzyme
MNFQCRAAALNDFPAMLALWQRCQEMGLMAADTSHGFARLLERNPGLSQVAELDGELIGTALCAHDGRRGYIYHLAVVAEHRKQGIGQALVQQCLDGLRQAGIVRSTVVVFASNLEGQRYWKKLGWRRRDDVVMYSRDL